MPPEIEAGGAREWLERAKGKLALARQPLPEGGYWEDLCYMAQQAAELSLKAIYQKNGWRFAYVHDIGHLLDGLENYGLPVPESIREAEILTVYATQMRYPGSYGFITEHDYLLVVATAKNTVDWASYLVTR